MEAPPRQRIQPRRHVGGDDLGRGVCDPLCGGRHVGASRRSSGIAALTRLGRRSCTACCILAALLGLAALAACGRDARDASIETTAPPGLAERFLPPPGWAWGALQVATAPAQRYGVAAATGVAKAQILILPDYGESAETWFETVHDLTGGGDTVWVLEGVGEGGSGRLTGRRDLGEVRSFDTDVAAARAMIALVVRPTAQRPLVLMGEGVGALVAARLAEQAADEPGAAAASLILSAPDCRHGLAPGALVFLGLGQLRAPGADAWRRDSPDDLAAHRTHDAFRGAVTHAWQTANPDLRLGGPSLDYQAAIARLQRLTAADLARLRATPTLVLQPAGAPACLTPPGASVITLAAADPALELEDNARRAPWLAAIQRFAAQTAARTHPIPGLAPS